MRKPDFFIVGAPKCGTTALYDYLRQHPEIFVPYRKELHFFGTDLISGRPRRTEQDYLALFARAADEKRVGEASVLYLYSKLAASEIKAFCPSASIIIMLRNPVDMMYSLHSQLLFTGDEEITDFEAALEAEEERKRGSGIPESTWFAEALFYRETARYTEQVRRYFDVFGRDNVHLIIFDDFRGDTAGVYRQTLRFLGVDETFRADFRIVNPNKHARARSKRLMRFRYNYPLVVRRLGRLAVPSLPARRTLLRGFERLITRRTPHPPMDTQLRKRLQAEFAPEVETLSQLLGRDLTHWSRD